MHILKNIFLVIIIISFVFFSWVFLFAKGLERTAFNYDFYEDLFEEAEISKIINEKAADGMAADLPEDTPDFLEEGLVFSFKKTFDPEWIKETLLSAVKDTLDWLKDGEDDFALVVDLKDKEDEMQENMLLYAEQFSDQELMEMGISEEFLREGFAGEYREGIPEEIVLTSENLTFKPRLVQESYRAFSGHFFIFSYLVIIIFALALYFALGVFSGLKWLGAGMLIAGATFFISLKSLVGILPRVVEADAELQAMVAAEELAPVLSFFVNNLAQPSLIFALLGFLILLAGIFLPRKSS